MLPKAMLTYHWIQYDIALPHLEYISFSSRIQYSKLLKIQATSGTTDPRMRLGQPRLVAEWSESSACSGFSLQQQSLRSGSHVEHTSILVSVPSRSRNRDASSTPVGTRCP